MSQQEIWIVPSFEQGSLMELCKHLTSGNIKLVIVIPSNLSSSVPDSLSHNPLVSIAEIPSGYPPHDHQNQTVIKLEKILSTSISYQGRPVSAIIDVMMHRTAEIFHKFNIPTIALFASGACSAATELAMWRTHSLDLKPGEFRFLPRQPEEIPLTYKQRPHGPPGCPLTQHHGAGHQGPGPDSVPPSRLWRRGPPEEGDRPPWVELVEGSIAVMINTCEDLERPFLEYMANQMVKPVWGVGPLLLEQCCKSVNSIIHDRESQSNRWSNVTDDEVLQWLDSKPRKSILYVSFDSEVGPSIDEYSQLASALEASSRPFIWVIQTVAERRGSPGPSPRDEGYFPHGLDSKVGPRGLIIQGKAPQLLILSHPSTGGFLSHCGWNSTVEAIGHGVPFLAWPDQYHEANVKLVVAHLKVGHMISDDSSEMITQKDIVNGIEKLLEDEEMKGRAIALADKFRHGLPATSKATLDAFTNSIHKKVV
ncbi:hypothetical protein UlMin_001020 [Ulmus minor]